MLQYHYYKNIASHNMFYEYGHQLLLLDLQVVLVVSQLPLGEQFQ